MPISAELCCPRHVGQQVLKPIRLLYFHKEPPRVRVWGSGRERKYCSFANAVAASLSCNDLAEQKNPHGNESMWWRKPQLIPLLLFQLKFRGGKSRAMWSEKLARLQFYLNVTFVVKPIGMTSPKEDICFPFEWGLFSLKTAWWAKQRFTCKRFAM